MVQAITAATAPRDAVTLGDRNNFDAIRFGLAFIVFLVHAYELSQSEGLRFLSGTLSSQIAVQSFFVVSGFLIFMSYEKTKDLRKYAAKRIRRIYPAYAAVVILSAVLGCFISSLDASSYFSRELLKYLVANLVFLNFLQPNLPGVFSENAYTEVNGALWTLKIEVLFYMAVPLFAFLFRKLGTWRVIIVAYLLSVLYEVIMQYLAAQTGRGIYVVLARQLPGQLSYFMAGAFIYYYWDAISRWSGAALLAGVGAYAAGRYVGAGLLEPLGLALIVVYLSYFFRYLGNFGRYGDFSYGIYILHFPVLQTLIFLGLFNTQPFVALVVAAGVVVLLAFLLWHGIEKRFLRKSSHYRAVTT